MHDKFPTGILKGNWEHALPSCLPCFSESHPTKSFVCVFISPLFVSLIFLLKVAYIIMA